MLTFGLRQPLGDFSKRTRLVRAFDHEHFRFEREVPVSPKSMSALVGSLTTMRTTE